MNTSFQSTGFQNPGFSPFAANSCGPDCPPFCMPGIGCSTGGSPFGFNAWNQGFNSPFGGSGWNAPQAFNGFGGNWNSPSNWSAPFNQNTGWNTNGWNNSWNNSWNTGFNSQWNASTPFSWNQQGWNQPFGQSFGQPFNGFSNSWNAPINGWNNAFGGSFAQGFGNAWNTPFNGFGGFNQFASPFGFGGFNQFASPSWNMPFGFVPFAGANTQQTTSTTKGSKKSEGEPAQNVPFGGMYPFPMGFTPFGYFNPAAFGQCEQNCAAA